MTKMEFKIASPFHGLTVKTNTIVANRIGYTGKSETPESIDLPTSAEMHKRLFGEYWRKSDVSYTVIGGVLWEVEHTGNTVRVTRA